MTNRPDLVFVSTRFLFPADSGGKIRTSQILRGLKGGHFRVRLLAPCTEACREKFATEIDSVCDELVSWEPRRNADFPSELGKALLVFGDKPIPVLSDRDANAAAVIAKELQRQPSVAVFDFPHSAILAPRSIDVPSVMFTHNIEAEIFRRHLDVAATPVRRWLWKNQYRKMLKFERDVLNAFDAVVAVSERDCAFFENEYGASGCRSIPTGVDTEFLSYVPPGEEPRVVFCGSMDWLANSDGIEFFHDEVWPRIRSQVPSATMTVVGRSPPDGLIRKIQEKSKDWNFTGFVDDVRDHVPGCAAFVIPLRVGGGTRIKAFEAMAMGCPVVSTSIGIEGLPVEAGRHYLNADSAEDFADAVVTVLTDGTTRRRVAADARALVEQEFGFRKAASVFEEICLEAVQRGGNQSNG